MDLPPAIRAKRSGDPLEDGRADPAAKAIGCIPVAHDLIIGEENRLAADPVARKLSRNRTRETRGGEDAPGVHVRHEGLYDLEGYDACRNERSTWASWRM
jgi:hypothetical protein